MTSLVPLTDFLLDCVRVFFLAVLPLIIAGGLAGIVASSVRIALSVHDHALSYSLRLFACCIALGAVGVSFFAGVERLLEKALSGGS